MPNPRLPVPRLVGLAIAMTIALPVAGLASAEPIDLEGTWYVLIHYRDPATANPEADRWKDLVWVFERRGSRLQWTEYPLVVFEDSRGRFERLGPNPASRVLDAWEPNAGQREEIAAGPRVNQRGKRVKSMRGSNERGWASPRRPPTTSAMVMSYQEHVRIDHLDALPIIRREDFVGNALTKDSGGGTDYRVESIERDGRRLIGRYERDERQKGTFRMWRTPPVRGLREKEENEEGGNPPSVPPSAGP